jgi:hypothetical protein
MLCICQLLREGRREAPQTAAGRTAASTGAHSDEVDQDSEDSFPASDPPSFTPVIGIRTPGMAKGMR